MALATIEKIKDKIFEADATTYHAITEISSTKFAISYVNDDDNDVIVKAYDYDSEDHSFTLIGTYTNDLSNTCSHTDITFLTSHSSIDYCLLTYTSGGTLAVRLIKIDSTLDTVTSIDSSVINTTSDDASMAKYNDNVVLVAYHNTTDASGRMATITVDTSYTSVSVTNDGEHSNIGGTSNALINIDSNMFILAYYKQSTKGQLKCFTIDTASPYDWTEQSATEMTTGETHYNSLIKVSSTQAVWCYNSSLTGEITRRFITRSKFTLAYGTAYSVVTNGSRMSVAIEDSTLAIAWTDAQYDGNIAIYNLSTLALIAGVEFNSNVDSAYPTLLGWDDDKFLMAHYEGSTDGKLVLFGEESFKINVTESSLDSWKRSHGGKISIGNLWKNIESVKVSINGEWEDVDYIQD